MIPVLTIDNASVTEQWKEENDRKRVTDMCSPILIKGDIPVYNCEDFWVDMGVFNEAKSLRSLSEFLKYGYCDTEDALSKHLQSYKDDSENSYFVEVHGTSMKRSDMYKCGNYINKDGIDTGCGYHSYILAHPKMKVKQDVKDRWIGFSIRKLNV